MKKLIKTLLLAAVAAAALSGCSSKAAPEKPADNNSTTQASSVTEAGNAADGTSYTIGVGQFAEHGSLDNCREGFIQGLAEEGIEEGKNLTVLYENAQADGGTASQIVNNFLSKKVDLICGIATPMAQAAYSGAKKASVPSFSRLLQIRLPRLWLKRMELRLGKSPEPAISFQWKNSWK